MTAHRPRTPPVTSPDALAPVIGCSTRHAHGPLAGPVGTRPPSRSSRTAVLAASCRPRSKQTLLGTERSGLTSSLARRTRSTNAVAADARTHAGLGASTASSDDPLMPALRRLAVRRARRSPVDPRRDRRRIRRAHRPASGRGALHDRPPATTHADLSSIRAARGPPP